MAADSTHNLPTIGILLLLSGCAASPPQQLAAEDLARIRQEPPIIAVVYQPPPPFQQSTAFTEGISTIGAVGSLASMQASGASGAQTTRGIELVNPSIRVRDQFVAGMTSEFALPQPTVHDNVNSDDIERLRAALGPGVVLDFKTVSWGIGTYRQNPFRQDLFRVNIIVRARLIRLGEQRILWENLHGILSRDAATVQQLQQNDGALLKRWLAEAADMCAKDLIAKFSARSKPQ
jgi:hypothetical protein